MDTTHFCTFPSSYAPFWDHTPMHTHPGTHRHTLISVVFLPTEFIRFQMPLLPLLRSRGHFSRLLQKPSHASGFSQLSPCQKWVATWQADTATHCLADSALFSLKPLKITWNHSTDVCAMACLIHKNIRARGLSLSHAQRMFPGSRRKYDIKYYQLTDKVLERKETKTASAKWLKKKKSL